MRVLTLFNYEDFIKIARKYKVEEVVGICQHKRSLGSGFVEVEIKASASSKDTIVELVYYRIVEASVALEDKEDTLVSKGKELKGRLEKEGFEVVEGYWHGSELSQ